jgi:hypothetical protein
MVAFEGFVPRMVVLLALGKINSFDGASTKLLRGVDELGLMAYLSVYGL